MTMTHIRFCLALFPLLWLVPCGHAQQLDSATLIQDIRTLASTEFAGRKPGTEGHQKALQYITQRFAKLGLPHYGDSYIDSFTFRNEELGQNIIGYIPGQTTEAIVVSGHYDHLGERGGELYLGADDNASGAAALLSLAAYFSTQQPYYTLIFAAFDAEESGLQGARAFVADPPLPIEDIVLNVNMDMISRNDKNELYAAGSFHYPQLLPMLQIENEHISLRTGHDNPALGRRDDWTNQSDHAVFHRLGIPFVYFGVEDHPDYHTPNDTFENIQPGFYYQSTRIILQFLKNVDLAGKLAAREPARRDLIMH